MDKRPKKTLICMNKTCRNVFVHRGCTCKSKCPKCGDKGTSVELKNGKIVY